MTQKGNRFAYLAIIDCVIFVCRENDESLFELSRICCRFSCRYSASLLVLFAVQSAMVTWISDKDKVDVSLSC